MAASFRQRWVIALSVACAASPSAGRVAPPADPGSVNGLHAGPGANTSPSAARDPNGRVNPSSLSLTPATNAPNPLAPNSVFDAGPPDAALRFSVQQKILGVGKELQDASGTPKPYEIEGITPRINGNALGLDVGVEPSSALALFHQRLAEFQTHPLPSQKLRILVYGASHTEADYYTSYLRYYLQDRFGDGGQGFVALGKVNEWYRLLGARVESSGVRVQYAQSRQPEVPGRFGLFGAAASASSKHAFARIIPHANDSLESSPTEHEFSFLAGPDYGDLLLQIDDEPAIVLSARAPQVENRMFHFSRSNAPRRIEVRPAGNGVAHWYGVISETAARGVVVDTLGINGTRAANLLTWDEALWSEQIRRRDPALVMLAYGTNEALDQGEPIEHYALKLREVLTRVKRAAPRASCVLIGPGDFQRKGKTGEWAPRARSSEIVATQRQISAEIGCGFWDLASFMGGAGGVETWRRALPPMASEDRVHLTPRGYVRMGMGLTDALLQGFSTTERVGIRKLPSNLRTARANAR